MGNREAVSAYKTLQTFLEIRELVGSSDPVAGDRLIGFVAWQLRLPEFWFTISPVSA